MSAHLAGSRHGRRGPRVLVLPDQEAVAEVAAERLADTLRARPDAVLGFATGRTMEPVYARLATLAAAGTVSVAQASSFNLDEYVGLGPEDLASFASFMRRRFAEPTGFDPDRMCIPDGLAPDPDREARRYEAEIAASGGIALQLLGIGRNGHVAFNEPGSSPGSRTRVVRLAPETRAANAAAFAGRPVPERAITVGLATIREAEAILLVATGATKAAALAGMLEGPVGPHCPASCLRDHPDLTVLCDAAAASRLTSSLEAA